MARHFVVARPWTLALAVAAASLLAIVACIQPAVDPPRAPGEEPADPAYVPRAVFCPDGSDTLCGRMPSMIGADPALPRAEVGYDGLRNDVTSFDEDIQSPFDNMAWQMFYALNRVANGKYAWQGYPRVEDVFGGDPSPCANPEGLPEFTLTAKSDGQPSNRDEEILQAATDKPLIDKNGNWTLFERRLNAVEKSYLKNEKWDLTTLAGQKKFVEAGNAVDFTPGAVVAEGAVGAMELKMAWRVLDPHRDDPSRYLTLDALLAVDAAEVRGSDQPICDRVQLGLVGFHILQKNPQLRSLLPEWIWASFEHQENVPLSATACDPVDSDCYLKPTDPVVCGAASAGTRAHSYYDEACRKSMGPCPINTAPTLLTGEQYYLWEPTQPYAKPYLYNGKYGTQITRCWQIYGLTRQLNAQWQRKIRDSGSVLHNYMLIGTQWGANVEPTPGTIANGAVPAFLSNSTMESYIQTKEYGSCIVCHRSATLAYSSGTGTNKTTYDADFSFLLQLAE